MSRYTLSYPLRIALLLASLPRVVLRPAGQGRADRALRGLARWCER